MILLHRGVDSCMSLRELKNERLCALAAAGIASNKVWDGKYEVPYSVAQVMGFTCDGQG